MTRITWSAKNNSSYLNGTRAAVSMRAAVRDARRYVWGELYGEGVISYYKDGQPKRCPKCRSLYWRIPKGGVPCKGEWPCNRRVD